jgi:hypothetical protein
MAGRSRRASSLSARITRKFVVPAVMLASLGAIAAASPGAPHPSAGHVRLPRAAALTVCVHNKLPWMYAATNKLPWMYAATNRLPWMYAVRAGHPRVPRAACAATTRRQLA